VLRSHQGEPSAVLQVACCGDDDFIEYFLHPPQPREGRVISMIQLGAYSGTADARKVFQSPRLAGEKIFIPFGQLFFWVDLYTVLHCVHFTRNPARYFPDSSTFEHLQAAPLPDLGLRSSAMG